MSEENIIRITSCCKLYVEHCKGCQKKILLESHHAVNYMFEHCKGCQKKVLLEAHHAVNVRTKSRNIQLGWLTNEWSDKELNVYDLQGVS